MNKKQKDQYTLITGEKGQQQLDALDRTFGKESRKFLMQLAISKHKVIADIGCGVGNLSIWMAKQVSNQGGKVLAVDEAEGQLRVAKARAAQLGVTNIEFIQASAYDLSDLPACDFVYCRYVLTHLSQPQAALMEMGKLITRQGILACEEPTTETRFTYPPYHGVNKLFHLIAKMLADKNCDLNIGIHLYQFMHDLPGFNANIQFSQGIIIDIEELKDYFQRVKLLLQSVRETLLKTNLASEEELNRLLEDIESAQPRHGDLIAHDRISQVWAVRE